AAGRSPLPEDVRVAHGLRRSDVAAGAAPEKARAALGEVLEAAEAAYGDARRGLRGAPSALWPAVGCLALVPGYLRRLRRPGRDAYRDTGERPLLARQFALFAGALRGGV
ncbi:MAG: squalene/phytoene synthase family protein, partial [Caulobacterales bacterium]|nr:squalene/phytoene synthase family protein [Caulobacterales bacterium]